jgi:methionyl-tRNA synthetase
LHTCAHSFQTTLDAKGLLYKDTYEGWYAVADETFYTPAQIAPGVVPGTHVAVETGAIVEWTREENWKFRLSAFQPWLLEHFAAAPRVFPEAHQEWVLRTLRETPLEDLSVSRPRSRLEWGVPVPGDPDHTVYVWFDALMCYLSGLGYPWSAGGPSSGAAAAWPPNIQVVGKDIVRHVASPMRLSSTI